MPVLDAWMVGAVLVLVEFARSVPALARVRRRGTTDAVSPESLGVYLGTGAGWVVLAVLVDAWWVAAATTLWLGFQVLICRAVVAVTPAKRTRLVRAATGAGAVFAAATALLTVPLGVVDALGLTLGAAMVCSDLPALIEGLTSPTTTGLSAVSLSVNAGEGLIYLLLGTGTFALTGGTPTVVIGYLIFGAVSLASNVPRLVRVCWRRARGREHATTAGLVPAFS